MLVSLEMVLSHHQMVLNFVLHHVEGTVHILIFPILFFLCLV